MSEDTQFNFISDDDIKPPNKKEIFEKVLESYLPLLENIDDIEDDLNEIEKKHEFDIDKLKNKTETNEKSINENYTDLKQKILKLVELIKESKNHVHEEFEELDELEELTDSIQSEIEDLKNKNEKLNENIEDIKKDIDKKDDEITDLINKNKELYTKMTQLARSHLSLKKEFEKYKKVQDLKNESLLKSVESAKCESCGEKIDILSLQDTYCPKCNNKFTGIIKNIIFSNIITVEDK